jgi:O-antigen/teichoic acid export membrane protein
MAALSVIVLWALQSPFEALLTARERMVSIAVVNLVAGVARLACTYLALRLAPTSVMAHGGIAVGNLLGFLLCIGVTISLTGWERPHFRPGLALRQVRESLPFSLAALFSLIYFKSDMSILKWLQGETAAGVYTWAQRLMEPLLMIAGIWGTAVFPALCRFSVTAPENYARLKKTSARLALLIAFPMAFGIAFLAEPIVALLTGATGETIAQSVFVLRVLCGVVPFFYINGVAQEFLYSSHHNWFVVASYGMASMVSVAGNLLLIPWLGVPAVAYTAVAANLIISVLFVGKMQSEYGTMGLISLVVKTVIACFVMGFAAYWLSGASLLPAIVVGVLVYAALQWALRTLTPEERRLAAGMAAAPFRRTR